MIKKKKKEYNNIIEITLEKNEKDTVNDCENAEIK
jgi:hypothetical protein